MHRHSPFDPVPRSCLPRAFPFNLSSVSFSSASLFFHPKKERPVRLSVSLLLHILSLLSGRGLSLSQAPSKTHALSVVTVCTPFGSPFHVWCATSGATAATPGFIPQQTTSGWPCGDAPHAPHRSHLQHPPGSRSPLTRSTLSSGDSISLQSISFRPSSSPVQTSTVAPGPALGCSHR